MNRDEQQAILTISLMAAFADGQKDEFERAELKRLRKAQHQWEAGSSIGSSDFKGLRFLADRFGERLAGGIVLYTGRDTVRFGPRLAAVPMSALWQS